MLRALALLSLAQCSRLPRLFRQGAAGLTIGPLGWLALGPAFDLDAAVGQRRPRSKKPSDSGTQHRTWKRPGVFAILIHRHTIDYRMHHAARLHHQALGATRQVIAQVRAFG
jgi:hypothetical protein